MTVPAEDPSGRPGPALRKTVRASAGIVMIIGIAMGACRIVPYGKVVFRDAPHRIVDAQYRRDIELVRRHTPPGSAFFYLTREQEHWLSRLWQRMFYPDPVFIIQGEQEWRAPRTGQLRERFGIRFAFSAGAPPIDPGYEWRIDLTPSPGESEKLWFGRLASSGASD